jgi:two-component system response regulator AtoC
MGGHVVLVVQNPQLHEQLIQGLAGDGFVAMCFRSVEDAIKFLREPGCPAIAVVFNVTMRRQSDAAALTELIQERPDLRILVVAQDRVSIPGFLPEGNPSLQLLERPLNHRESVAILRKVLQLAATSAVDSHGEPHLGQNSSLMPYSDEFLRRVGMAEVPVLLSGETGVGKEVMARKLCAYSRRASKPFLKLNCAALPPELAESELFGSAKGAFTGATADRQGRFETAQGGTILLDEIGDMDLRLQTKLLQVLQDGEIQPLGSNRTIQVDVRVMAATHRDLSRAIQEGAFREDLYYRLNVIKIVIPPLRERRSEILPLAEALLARHLTPGQKAPILNEELRRFLQEYRWPGNVRELENVMRRFLVYQDSTMLIRELVEGLESTEGAAPVGRVSGFPAHASEKAVPAGFGGQNSGGAFSASAAESNGIDTAGSGRKFERLEAAEKAEKVDKPDGLDRLAEASRLAETELLLTALEASRWNRRQAAASLGIEYKAFLYKLQKYGIVEPKGKRREISA